MKKLMAVALILTLVALVITPQAEAGHGAAFVLGALAGAVVAGAIANSYYAYPPYYAYPRPVVVQQPVYQQVPLYQPVYQQFQPVYAPPVYAPAYPPGYGPVIYYRSYPGWYR